MSARLRITSGKGFHLDMMNGFLLSVQIGPGNYCDNYDEPFSLDQAKGYRLPPSFTAEIALLFNGDMLTLASGDTVAGRVPVTALFNAIPALMQADNEAAALSIINAVIKETA